MIVSMFVHLRLFPLSQNFRHPCTTITRVVYHTHGEPHSSEFIIFYLCTSFFLDLFIHLLHILLMQYHSTTFKTSIYFSLLVLIYLIYLNLTNGKLIICVILSRKIVFLLILEHGYFYYLMSSFDQKFAAYFL